MRLRQLFLSLLALTCSVAATTDAPASPGDPYRVHALVGARVIVRPGEVIDPATVVIRDGVIEAVGADVDPPADAYVWDTSRKTIHAGFIDTYVLASKLTKKKAEKVDDKPFWERDEPREVRKEPGASHDLPWVAPEHDAAAHLRLDKKAVEPYRALGFVAVQAVPDDGIFRGRTAVVSLGDGTVNRLLLRDGAMSAVSFEGARGAYPSSLMGVIAVIRQTLYDGDWYAANRRAFGDRPVGRERPQFNHALEALGPLIAGEIPVLFDLRTDPLNLLRAGHIVTEHRLDPVFLGTGREYVRLAEVAALETPIIVPIDFPAPPKIGDDDDEWALVPTSALERWKWAPVNARWLTEAGVEIALTTHRLKKLDQFRDKLRDAIDAGLGHDAALAALTTVPARLLGLDHSLGTIEPGKIASLVVASGAPFEKDTRLDSVWVDGTRYTVDKKKDKARPIDIDGAYYLRMTRAFSEPVTAVLVLERKKGKRHGTLTVLPGDTGLPTDTAEEVDCVELDGDQLLVGFAGELIGAHGPALLVGRVSEGALTALVDAGRATWQVSGERMSDGQDIESNGERRKKLPPPPVRGGPLATPEAVVVRGATLWTIGPSGTMESADLLIRNGKIEAIGRDLEVPDGAFEIDGSGKHVTPGLIDAHSHTAISGMVNEGTNAVTAEVRIGDVVDSEDWNIYSQLAGGLTVANQLHGSANPIGGQSQTIKLRWGSPPEKLKFEGSKPGIKFALGENVKQSNWGDKFNQRYPQTRLGVEQVMRERFHAARDYLRKWDDYRAAAKKDKSALRPRKDLQLETIAEIIRGERLIHCHSYRQDEILMLVRVMQDFGVIIGTFQHVLEGYKVANELAEMGAGASTFADWWAYKFEVYDAIPYNGALMWDRGVVVSFNSDSRELARRLNTEATKAVKYGGVPEDQALAFVTLNPAKQLRIDHRVGSLEVGKDGDFVIWNDHPLSTMALAEQTWVDGQQYFDRAQDIAAREDAERRRRKLIREAKRAAKKNKKGKKGKAETGGGPL